jgi:hypothetical protein
VCVLYFSHGLSSTCYKQHRLVAVLASHDVELMLYVSVLGLQHAKHGWVVHLLWYPQCMHPWPIQQGPIPRRTQKELPSTGLVGLDLWVV